MVSATPSLAMQGFLVLSRDASLANSLHKVQGLTGIPEIMEWPRGEEWMVMPCLNTCPLHRHSNLVVQVNKKDPQCSTVLL